MNRNCVDKGWNNFPKWDKGDTVCNNFANLSDFLQNFLFWCLHSHTFPTGERRQLHSSGNKPSVILTEQVKIVGLFLYLPHFV